MQPYSLVKETLLYSNVCLLRIEARKLISVLITLQRYWWLLSEAYCCSWSTTESLVIWENPAQHCILFSRNSNGSGGFTVSGPKKMEFIFRIWLLVCVREHGHGRLFQGKGINSIRQPGRPLGGNICLSNLVTIKSLLNWNITLNSVLLGFDFLFILFIVVYAVITKARPVKETQRTVL